MLDLDRIRSIHLTANPRFRYNYWPPQHELWRKLDRVTATWVGDKYYEHPLLAKSLSQNKRSRSTGLAFLVKERGAEHSCAI